jgi:NADPH:quinone reductase-like Zn-dependent oxidoreductase
MKAVLLTGHGGPEMLRYGDAPDPMPAPDEIVVDVHAASVNAQGNRLNRLCNN